MKYRQKETGLYVKGLHFVRVVQYGGGGVFPSPHGDRSHPHPQNVESPFMVELVLRPFPRISLLFFNNGGILPCIFPKKVLILNILI